MITKFWIWINIICRWWHMTTSVLSNIISTCSHQTFNSSLNVVTVKFLILSYVTRSLNVFAIERSRKYQNFWVKCYMISWTSFKENILYDACWSSPQVLYNLKEGCVYMWKHVNYYQANIYQQIYINIVLPGPWQLKLWPIYYTQMYIL